MAANAPARRQASPASSGIFRHPIDACANGLLLGFD